MNLLPLLVLLAAPPAEREPAIPPALWLAPVAADAAPGAALMARRFEDAARAELRKLKRVRLVGPKEKVERIPAGDPDPRVARAENLRTSGQARFEQGDLPGARADLEDARTLYLAALPSIQGIGVMGRTAAYLGAIAQADGRKKEARALLWEAALLATEEELEATPEAVRGTVADLRKRAARRPAGRLTVRSVPAGATVLVDGDERGVAPITVKKLAAGPHYVQIRHPEAGWAGARVDVKRAAKVTLASEKLLGPPETREVPGEVADALLEGLEAKPIESHSRSARRRAEKARAKRLTQALSTVRELTHGHYAVVARVAATDGRFELRGWVQDLQAERREALPPTGLGGSATNLFVPALAFRKAVSAAVQKLQQAPPEKRRKRRPRRR